MPSKMPVALLVIALAALLSACQGDASPSPQATPGGTPLSPAQATADLAAASQYQRNGQYEEAMAIYERLVQQASGEAQRQARYALAQAYIALGEHQQAIDELQAYIDSKPPQEDALRARFLLGRAYTALGKANKAREALRRYAEENGPAAVYAHLELAKLSAQAGRHDKAAEELEQALTPDLPASLAASLFLKLADAYGETGEEETAIQWYERLLQESPTDAYKALALSRIATLSRRLGDGSRWQRSLLDIVKLYPASPEAANALDALRAAEVPVAPLTQAIVHYRQRAYDQALAELDSFLAGEPSPAEAAVAHYYRGAIRDRQDELNQALTDYEASLQLDPAGDLAADAAWARADLLERLGLSLDAADAYRQVWQAYPDSPFAERAAFLSGLVLYQLGDPVGASAAWREMLQAFSSPERQAQAHLWLGKAARALGDREGAAAPFRQALEAAPDSFYALRAEDWLTGDGASGLADDSIRAASAPSWGEAEEWMAELWGPEATAASPSLLTQLGWQRAQELHRMGLSAEAGDEFLWLIEQSDSQPWSLYRLARGLDDLGLTHLAARAATRLLAAAAGPLQEAPRPLLELAYPRDYAPLIDAAAADNGVSPLLILALIRQESFFNAAASSPAGALGLAQIIPATGLEIAQQLDRPDFSSRDLLRPIVSIEFGAHYLASQLRSFGDNLYFALAAYNGGPGNALRWSEGIGASDMDLFVELIDFSETRTYLKLVLENYAMYRFLYGGADHPTLLAGPPS